MSESIETTERKFKLQFDSQNIFKENINNNGSFQSIDLNYKGDVLSDGKVTVKGVEAEIQKIILFFSSMPGDYVRSNKAGPFLFVFNSPASSSTQFRIVSTASTILSSRFPAFEVIDIQAYLQEKFQEMRGWVLKIVLKHSSIDGDIEITLPL